MSMAISCPEECGLCIGDHIWWFMSMSILFLCLTFVLFVYILRELLFGKDGQKLAKKFKILIILDHSLMLIASLMYTIMIYYDNICDWLFLIESGIWHLSNGYLLSAPILVIIFVERLTNALVNSVFEVNKWFRRLVIGVAVIQVILILSSVTYWTAYLYPYKNGGEDSLYLSIWYSERVLYVIVTLVILVEFILKFRGLAVAFSTHGASPRSSGKKSEKLIHIVAQQMLIVIICQFSTILANVGWFLTIGEDNGTLKWAFPTLFLVGVIDQFINCFCLHAVFPHGIKLYQWSGLKCISKKLVLMLTPSQMTLTATYNYKNSKCSSIDKATGTDHENKKNNTN